MSKLFSPFTIKNVTLKNRIVMSPMCMYSCIHKDGKVTDWHLIHYPSRAVGQVGLIMVEATAVLPEGRISEEDLGIWSDEQIAGLRTLVRMVHERGAKIGIQLAHAGRKSEVPGPIFAPSAMAFDEHSPLPEEMTAQDIRRTEEAFRQAAVRAREAGFDIIEIHAAHGYLINEFLSPLSNQRSDAYGGSAENRYRFLQEIIRSVKAEWEGPLFVRISADEYHEKGNGIADSVRFARMMKADGIDLIDCSSGGTVPVSIPTFPGYQVRYAEAVRREAKIATGAVGMITSGNQAEEILQNERADLVFLGRELLRNPYWPRRAALELGEFLEAPKPYERGWS